MAVCSLQTVVTPTIPHTLQTFNPRPSSITTTTTIKASSSSSSSTSSGSKNPSLNSNNPKPSKNRPVIDMGIGLLAASMVLSSPFEANATRIEYYATVEEPSCQLNFAPSGLGYCDIAVGFGDEAQYYQLLNIHYTARFADGIVFDSSYKRSRPLTMRIGVGKVIRGLDQGIGGGEGVPPMLVGGRRRLQIPPELAYGSEPAGCFSGDCNIPGNATLVYDINFVGVYSGNRPK